MEMDVSPVPTHGLALDEICFDGLRVFEAAHRPALRIAQHEHDLMKICIVLEGAFVERNGPDLRSLRPNDVLVRASRRVHINQYGGNGARSLLLELPPDHRPIAALQRFETSAVPPVPVARAAAQLVNAFHHRGPDRVRSTRAAMRSLVGAVLESATRRARPWWLDAIRERLNERFAEPLALDDLARMAGVHRVHVSQAFHAHFGQSLTAYLRALRVFHATELLWSGADITAAAMDCGFCDQSHLTHAFQRERQMAPGQYRAAMVFAGGKP